MPRDKNENSSTVASADTSSPSPVRSERDTMGEVAVPTNAYWGASTQRAIENFPVSGCRLPRSFLHALGLIKHAAAAVNEEDKLLPTGKAAAIKAAALEVRDGKLDEHFVVDVFQTGSGTSTNMNANEVIANRAIEILGGARGNRSLVHPNDDVNLGQSSNDVTPTAIHVSAALEIHSKLLPALRHLAHQLTRKGTELWTVVKTGRTHLQDATPVRFGQEFHGYAAQVARAVQAIEQARLQLSELALGGTAVGTGVNTRGDFACRVIYKLSTITGLAFRETDNHFQAQGSIDAVVQASSALRLAAVALMKIANDIRWMGSGPRAGLGELQLPEVQPGSSIMPGKVNPVIAESVCQVAAQVIGCDAAITVAGQSGNFELNVMMPVAAFNLLFSIEILANVSRLFADKCIAGLKATKAGPEILERGLALATALVPRIGYDRAAEIAKEAAGSGETVRAVALRKSGLSAAELDALLDAESMTRPDAPVSSPPEAAGTETANPDAAAEGRGEAAGKQTGADPAPTS